MSGQLRPSNDISKLLSPGPTAWEASEAKRICTGRVVNLPLPPRVMIRASRSVRPKGVAPLRWKLARPSQKLWRLKTALIIVGVLRGSTLRTVVFPPHSPAGLLLTMNPAGSASGSPLSRFCV